MSNIKINGNITGKNITKGDRFIVSCAKIKDVTIVYPSCGIEVECTICKEKIWLSDSTVIGIKNRHNIKSFDETKNLFPICEDHTKNLSMFDFMPLTPEQINELNKINP